MGIPPPTPSAEKIWNTLDITDIADVKLKWQALVLSISSLSPVWVCNKPNLALADEHLNITKVTLKRL